MSQRIPLSLLCTFLLFASPPDVDAVDRFWTGGAGTFIFNNTGNWAPVGVPFDDDLAWIDQRVTVTSTLTNHTEDLTLSDGAWLIVDSASGGFRVDDLTILAKTDSNSVQLFVENTPAVIDFDTDRFHVLGGAELDMEGGLCDVDVNLFVDSQSRITGRGSIDFGGGGEELTNNGTIRPDGGVLRLQSPTGGIVGPLDLDGDTEGGVIDVTSGTGALVIDAALADAFSGTTAIGDGNYLQFEESWSASATSTITMTGGAAGAASLRGAGTANLYGALIVSGEADITSDVILQQGSQISIGPGAELRLEGETTYVHPFISGSGTLTQVGPARVIHDTQIFAAVNFSSSGPVTLASADLQVSAPTVLDSATVMAEDANSEFQVYGHLIVKGLNVIDAKSVFGSIATVSINSGAELRLQRHAVLDATAITGNGRLIVRGATTLSETTIGSQVKFEPGAVSMGTNVHLAGFTEFSGATFGGFGPLEMDGQGLVSADTFIGSPAVDLDGSGGGGWTINPFRTLTIASLIVDPDNDEFNGKMTILEGGALEFTSGITWKIGVAGSVELRSPSARIAGRDVELVSAGLLPSKLTGEGQIEQDLINGGIVSPGWTIGALEASNYVQTPQGRLAVELTGPLAGEFDVLALQGNATLDGTLEIAVAGGFVPSPGDVFTIITCATMNGDFDTFIGQHFGSGAGQFFQPIASATHFSLYAPLLGDANFDGRVSGADFTVWADHFGASGDWSDGDYSGDGQVTGADFTIWADHFGQAVTLDVMSMPAPEPSASSLTLTTVASLPLLSILLRRGRRLRYCSPAQRSMPPMATRRRRHCHVDNA